MPPETTDGKTFADFLTVGQAARFLGVTAETLRNWDRRGKVEALRHPVNGYRLYRREDLTALVEQVTTGKRSSRTPPSRPAGGRRRR